MIDGIPSDDPLNRIAAESLQAESEQAAQGEYIPPGESAEDRQKKAREKADRFITGMAWAFDRGLAYYGSSVQVGDEVWMEGIEKFTPVFEKYDNDITPEWFRQYIEPYLVEIKAGLWFGGVCFAVARAVKKERAQAEQETDNADNENNPGGEQ